MGYLDIIHFGVFNLGSHLAMPGGGVTQLKEAPQAREAERHTTHANIVKFFDPLTYRRDHVDPKKSDTRCQKRPASEASSSQPAVAKAKTMSKQELMEKFQLAAQLNGIDWDEMTVS